MTFKSESERIQLGATFIPGGYDDYSVPTLPELMSPSPQRIMHEVPEQMQDNLATLELNSKSDKVVESRNPSLSQESEPGPSDRQPSKPTYDHTQNNTTRSHNSREASISSANRYSFDQYRFSNGTPELPNFSPFPRLVNHPPNVPPTDDEKESILENARIPVLKSNDTEMQLAWAQDALAYADSAQLPEHLISGSKSEIPITPHVEHQLRVDAMNIVTFLAEQHHPKAEFMKGMWLEFGKFGIRMDKKEAFRCYSRAADKGYARAEYRIGMQYEQANEPAKSLIHYKRGLEASDSASTYRLAMMTLLGQHGQQQDYNRGVHLIRKAAATADENAPQGAYVLGMLQARELPQISIPEIFLPLDENSARANIEKAAFLGFAKAQVHMGQAYELCNLGCEFNPALSLHYNALASRQGEAEADMAICKWFLCGYEGVFSKNEELAYSYANRAASAGLPMAEFAVGYFNEIGMNTPVDLEKALEWYEKAAKNGNKDAIGRIDAVSTSRTLSKRDHENVAIGRIKSQYGSRRDGRPERFKQQESHPLGTISDNDAEPSDAKILQGPPGKNQQVGSSAAYPPRTSSSTPYPLEDKPATVISSQYERTSTSTPYPVGDGPPRVTRAPGPSGGFFAPELTSGSTGPPEPRRTAPFGINPNLFNPSNAGPGARAHTGGLGPNPYPNMEASDHRGRGQNGRSGGGGAPQNFRRPQRESVELRDGPPRLQKLDIGFSAPSDDHGNRMQRPLGPRNPVSSVPDIGFQAPIDNMPHRSPTNPQGLSFENPHRVSSPHERPATVQPLSVRPSGRPTASRPVSSFIPKIQKTDSMPAQQLQSSAEPPRTGTSNLQPTTQAAVPAKVPGKGPKTFEEMGVPEEKKEGDCVIM